MGASAMKVSKVQSDFPTRRVTLPQCDVDIIAAKVKRTTICEYTLAVSKSVSKPIKKN